MQLPKPVIAAVAAAGLIGGAAGAVVLAPAISGAQDAPEATAPEGTPPEGPGGHHHRGPKLDAAAEVIGVEVDALREALMSGQTLAEVAQANGVDPQVVIDALVAEANAHLDEAVTEGRLTQEEADAKRAELAERITTMVNEGRPERPEGEGPGRHHGPRLDAAAEVIGVEVDALREALMSGQTLAEVAQANGVDPQVVIDALVAEANAHLDEAVTEGRLTQEEADAKRAELAERITTMVNEGRPERPEGEGPGRRGPARDEAPEDAPADAPEAEGSVFSGSAEVTS